MTLLLSMPGPSEWVLIFLVLGLFLIPTVFYLLTLQSTLNCVSLENRKMRSVNVWMLLIPVFGFIWHFIVVNNVADSIKAEAKLKNIQLDEHRPGYNLGLAMCILNCLFFIPGLNILTTLAGFICWVLYWVKINSYKKIIQAREGQTETATIIQSKSDDTVSTILLIFGCLIVILIVFIGLRY